MEKNMVSIFVVAILVVLAGCGEKTQNSIADAAKTDDNVGNVNSGSNVNEVNAANVGSDVNTESEDTEANAQSDNSQASEVTINVLAKGPTDDTWSFEPSEIKVKQGAKVTLVITVPADDVDHAISIPEFNVNKVILRKGTTETVEFTADKKGEFSFFCSLFCGSGHKNMKGKVIVE